MRSFFMLALSAVVLWSCHGGPVEPNTVRSPNSEITVQPEISSYVGLPENRPPQTSMTADGKMLIVFHLQNQTKKRYSLQYQATFYDAGGVPVDEQGTKSLFLQSAEIQAVRIASTSNQAKSVLVQVRGRNQ